MRKTHIVEAGSTYGILTAVEPVEARGHGYWRFSCACGGECVTRARSVTIGKSKTCGCKGRPKPSSSDHRFCMKCKTEKPVADFYVRKNGSLWSDCKKCNNIQSNSYTRQRYKCDPDFVRALAANQTRLRAMPGTRVGLMWRALKSGAEKRGIRFAIEKEDIRALAERQQWTCARTGLPLDLTMGKGQLPFGPTIDRIDNERGYEVENIQLVCYIYNVAKNRFTDEDVLKFAEALSGHSPNMKMITRAA